ncbi:MAG: pitrilysin family protein [Sphingomonas adhaesiva]|uniref:M16 family metallopeptidase n=1 Tax=Sphingomonas adhaesiva TaxID=28212 RepID=UPI002FFB7E3D
MTARRLLLPTLLLTQVPLAVAATAQTPAAARVAAPRIAYDRFTLPNGLTVLVHTDRSSPSVFVGVWYKTGSRDEPPGRTGFAHLFEHLMFQSTAHRPQEYLSVLQRIGAVGANGITKTDSTAYYQTVPSNALDTILWLESDRMGYLDGGITQALLDEQRRIVLNEKHQGELRPEERAWRHFLGAFYPAGHPYAHPTIGSTADIESATLDDVKQWFRSHYGAGNAVLVLSGDIDVATARDKVARYFGAIRPGEPISRPLQWTPALTETRRDVLYGNFAQATIDRNWPVANGDPRERTLLLLAARAMAGAKESPLVRALVTEQKVATGVSATINDGELGSVLSVTMAVAPGVSPDMAGKALDRALADYAARGPDADRLRRIVAATDTLLLRGLEQNATVGTWLADGEVARGDPGFMLRQRDWIIAASPAEVRTVAARWLARPFYELVTLPTPVAAPLPADVDRSRMPEPGPADPTIPFPAVTRSTLANGMTLVVARRPGVGMVDMMLQVPLDARADRRGLAARAVALLPAADPATPRPAAADLDVAAQSDVWSGSLRWSVPADRVADSLATIADMVRRPAYPAAVVDAANAAATQAFDGYERNPSAAGVAILRRAILGDADARGHIATRQDPRDIPRQALLDVHARIFVPGRATLYMVGDVAPDQAKALAERAFAGWRAAPVATPDPAPPSPPAYAAPRIILVDAPGAAQSSITVGGVVPPFAADDAATEALVDAMVTGIGAGRLNRNLRADKGWSYGFGGGIDDAPRGQRLFVASGMVQADRTAQSLAELAREFVEVTTTRPLTQAELDGQRDAMTRAAAQQFSGNGAVLNALATAGTYGLPLDRAASTNRRLAAVTLERANALARRIFRPDGLTWVVVGDLKSIAPQIRALGLAPVETWDVYARPIR